MLPNLLLIRLSILRPVTAILVLIGSGVAAATEFAPPAAVQNGTQQRAGEALTPQRADQLIHDLGGATFAQRERAMGEILRLGSDMAPHLRQAIDEQQDPELVLRAQKILAQMTEDDQQAQIEAFLSGSPEAKRHGRQWFEGWAAVEQTLGDTPAVRELFIKVMQSHPEITRSLDANTLQRTAAVEQAAISVQMGMIERQQAPTLADGIAMLLPLTDPAVQIGAGYEATLMTVFNREVGTLRNDALLWPPVSELLGQWVLRSRIENRADVLWYAMQWDLAAAGALGMRTLEETTDVEMLQNALQAIARFGSAEDAPAVAKLLTDDRLAVTRMPVMVGNRPLKVTVADAALATIAILHKVPLRELGMRAAELHPKVGFLVDQAGYTSDQAEERATAMERALRWTSGQPPQGEPHS